MPFNNKDTVSHGYEHLGTKRIYSLGSSKDGRKEDTEASSGA